MRRQWFARWLRPRFTLGALLILVTLCAIPLGFVSYRRAHNEARKAAFESLTGQGFQFELQISQPMSATSEASPTSLQRWWRTLMKEGLVPPFTSINISDSRHAGAPTSDDDLWRLAIFPEIKYLTIHNAEGITDRGMAVVGRLPRLTSISVIGSSKVAGAFLERTPQLEDLNLHVQFDLAHVAALQRQTKLQQFRIWNAPLRDRDLVFLEKCDQLDSLHLNGLPTDGTFLSRLDRNAPLHFLSICGAPLTDENVTQLRRFPRLVDLTLSYTPLTGEFLPPPTTWPMLQRLDLQGTRFNETGKTKLAELQVPWHVSYPSNWNPSDFRRYQNAKLPSEIRLNGLFTEDAIAKSIPVFVHYPPNFQPPKISNCPQELMAPVIQLIEMAKAEEAIWKAKSEGK